MYLGPLSANMTKIPKGGVLNGLSKILCAMLKVVYVLLVEQKVTSISSAMPNPMEILFGRFISDFFSATFTSELMNPRISSLCEHITCK